MNPIDLTLSLLGCKNKHIRTAVSSLLRTPSLTFVRMLIHCCIAAVVVYLTKLLLLMYTEIPTGNCFCS